jgi:hypothetical protein
LFLVFFLFCLFLVTAPSKNGSAEFDDLYVKRRGLAQGSAFWASQRFRKLPRSSFSPKKPKFGPGIGMSSLNKNINNFSTDHAIFAQIAQSTQPGQTHPKFSKERQKFGSKDHFFGENDPQRGLQAKTRC